MKATVTLLRRHGMRLRQKELQDPLPGELIMTDWVDQNSYGRPIRQLELRQAVGSIMTARASLTDPEIIAIKDGSLVFRGIELETREGRVYEHEQVWRVCPSMQTDSSLIGR